MSYKRTAIVVLFYLSLAGVLVASSGCERQSSPAPAGEQAAAPAEEGVVGVLPEGGKRPDVIVILVDALRADRLGAYGSRRQLSPIMDKLASEGVTFDLCNAAAPWTLPSVASLFTSYYPGVHKATSYEAVESMDQGKRAVQSVLSDGFTTLAEVMQAGGYQTAGFVAAKFLREDYGFAQGFEHYDASFAENTVRGELVNNAFLKWVDEQRDSTRPMFAYLHFMDVHGPYDADPMFVDPLMQEVEAKEGKTLLEPEQFARINAYLRKPPAKAADPTQYERLKGYREYWEARYEAGVAEMNYYLMQLVAALDHRGLWKDAYVVLLSDHGEALCEHGWWEHGYSLHQTDLHVPLIMRWPGVLPAGARVRRLASLIDVMPTLIEQLRLDAGGVGELQGVSLVDHISGRLPDAPPQVRFAEGIKGSRAPRQYALYADITKLIVTHYPPEAMPDGGASQMRAVPRLYNLATDPDEMFDLSRQFAAQTKDMARLLGKMVEINSQTRPAAIAAPKPVDEETIAKLRAIGYAGGMDDDEDEEDDAP